MKKLYIKLILIICFIPILIKTRYINEIFFFIKESYKNIGTTGAIMPMSDLTCNTIASNIIKDFKSNNLNKISILEVGAGTGNMSEYIISSLEKENIDFEIDLIEINKEFANLLNKKFKNNKKVSVINLDVIDLNLDKKYNYIVSTLPFNSLDFSAIAVKKIFNKFQNMISYKGKIFWVEYALLGDIIKIFSNKSYKESYLKKHKIIDKFKNSNNTKKELIFLNIPPVYIYSAEKVK